MENQKILQPYLAGLKEELVYAVDHFVPGPAELDLMLRYHLGWMNKEGRSIDTYAGKQIRPLLTLLSCQVVGEDWHNALPAAAAVELLHNFSLIHDDIEDNSPIRRGRPALWKIWGVPLSINAGDAMFALAHMALLRLREVGVSTERVLTCAQIFEQTNLVLTSGQHLDMLFESRERVEVDDYLEMIVGKSAALIASSLQLGAVVGGASVEQVAYFEQFGRNLGIAFQIRDDILGIWGEADVMGKSAATDIVSRKKSLPVLFGLSQSDQLRALYAKDSFDSGDVDLVVGLLEDIGALDYARELELKYYQFAFDAFGQLEVFDEVSYGILQSIGQELLGRTF
jgi:geranylgeranyl diphosphate synthase type I